MLRAAPWEARTVAYDSDDGLFKAWYQGAHVRPGWGRGMGYAHSKDGVNWVKPHLGLYEYAGNTRNNICYLQFGAVIKDASDPEPERRYKMLVKPKPVGPPAYLACSPDGIHWREGPRLAVPGWPERPPDIAAFLFDEQDPDPQRRYKLIWQTYVASDKPGPAQVRAKCLSFSPDAEHWSSSTANPVLSPIGSVEHENHFLMLAAHAGQWVMPYEFGWYTPDGTGLHGGYNGDIRLAASVDGEHYHRLHPDQPLIARGRPGEWDESFLVISDTLAIKGDTMHFFYCGHGREWTSWPGSNVAEDIGHSSAYLRTDRMGLATLPLDRFTGVETADRETAGWVETGTIGLEGRPLHLHANLSDTLPGRSWIEVEVLDAATGEPVPGLSRDRCRVERRDGLRVPVRWPIDDAGDSDGFGNLIGDRAVRLRCWLFGAARLYALGFTHTSDHGSDSRERAR